MGPQSLTHRASGSPGDAESSDPHLDVSFLLCSRSLFYSRVYPEPPHLSGHRSRTSKLRQKPLPWYVPSHCPPSSPLAFLL